MDFFSVLSECAITLAGFSAIYSILQGSTGPRGAYRSIGTLTRAAAAFFLSILPLLLNQLEIPAPVLWSVCSAIAAFVRTLSLIIMWRIDGVLTDQGHPPQMGRVVALNFLVGLISVVLFAVNIFYWPESTRQFLYGLGIVLMMITPVTAMGVAFFLLLEQSLQDNVPEGSAK